MFVVFVKVPVPQSEFEVQNTEGAMAMAANKAMAVTDDNVRIEDRSFAMLFIFITPFRMSKDVNNVLYLKKASI